MADKQKPLKKSSFGTCSVERTSPPKVDADTKVVNVFLTFEEALKLNLAIDECVHHLGRYKRSTTAGKSAGLNLAVHLHQHRISVQEGKV